MHEAAAVAHYRGLPGADLTTDDEDDLADEGHLWESPVELGAPAVWHSPQAWLLGWACPVKAGSRWDSGQPTMMLFCPFREPMGRLVTWGLRAAEEGSRGRQPCTTVYRALLASGLGLGLCPSPTKTQGAAVWWA